MTAGRRGLAEEGMVRRVLEPLRRAICNGAGNGPARGMAFGWSLRKRWSRTPLELDFADCPNAPFRQARVRTTAATVHAI